MECTGQRPSLMLSSPPTAPKCPLFGLFSGNLTQLPLWATWNSTRDCGSPTEATPAVIHMSKATYLACYWIFGKTLAVPHWYQRGRAPIPVPNPVAPLQPCCGKTRQSIKLSSILIVQSRISDNLLSSSFFYLFGWDFCSNCYQFFHKECDVILRLVGRKILVTFSSCTSSLMFAQVSILIVECSLFDEE